MAGLSGGGLALLRLLAVQGAWSYERMQGIGMGWASLPVLRRLFPDAPDRRQAAVARAAAFFNANPYLTPTALGAAARAEADGLPGGQIERLRTALCGPLGALGDRLFWTGVVPGLSALAVALVALGAGAWPVWGLLAVHNGIRLWLGRRLLAMGWRHGPGIGSAITASRLPRLTAGAAIAATVAGAAAPLIVAGALLDGRPPAEWGLVAVVAGAAVVVRWLLGRRATAVKFTLVAAAAAVLWHLGRA